MLAGSLTTLLWQGRCPTVPKHTIVSVTSPICIITLDISDWTHCLLCQSDPFKQLRATSTNNLSQLSVAQFYLLLSELSVNSHSYFQTGSKWVDKLNLVTCHPVLLTHVSVFQRQCVLLGSGNGFTTKRLLAVRDINNVFMFMLPSHSMTFLLHTKNKVKQLQKHNTG